MLAETQMCLELEAPPIVAIVRAPRNNAEDTIRRVLMDVLPPNVPPSFRRVVRARFVGKTRILAELEMVDGLPSEIEAWQWPGGWAHRWVTLEGGDLSWEDGRWWRIDADGERA